MQRCSFDSRWCNGSDRWLLDFEYRDGDRRCCITNDSRPAAQAATVRAGQMLVVQSGASYLPKPVEIDLDRLMKTATLVTKLRPLPSLNLILAAIDDQKREDGHFINPDFTPTGLDARDVVAAVRSQSTPSPPKSGKPPQESHKP